MPGYAQGMPAGGCGHRGGWSSSAARSSGTDTDNNLEDSLEDPWTYALYNERWQLLVEMAGETSSGAAIPDDPTLCVVHHAAGRNGSGSSSYIDDVILADADTNGDGTLDERTYFVQNWRHDVVARLGASGRVEDWTDYTPYGEPIDVLEADFNADGEVGAGDYTTFTSQFTTADCGPSGCIADFDRDGDVDLGDFSTFGTEYLETYDSTIGTLPDGFKSRGYAGYVRDDVFELKHVRNRAYRADLGTWTRRDPLGYVDGLNLFAYVRGNAAKSFDPTGMCVGCGWGGGVVWHKLPTVDYFIEDKTQNPCEYLLDLGVDGPCNGGQNRYPSILGNRPPHEVHSHPGCKTRAPSPAPTTDAACCAAVSTRCIDGDGGGVICCNGRRVSCEWVYQGITNKRPGMIEVESCLLLHEDDHHDDVSCGRCPSGYICRPHFLPGKDVDAEECSGNIIEMHCLWDKMATDCLDPQKYPSSQDRLDCFRRIENRLRTLCNHVKQYNCPALPVACSVYG
ncbi:MAG: hypothetical protein Tsb0013_14930 [Phycisphaerales bacterium]